MTLDNVASGQDMLDLDKKRGLEKRSWWLWGLIVLVIGAGLAVIGMMFLGRRDDEGMVVEENPYREEELVLADLMLEWLDGRKTIINLQAELNTCYWYPERGGWFCQTGLRSHRAFFAPMWANFKYYQATDEVTAFNRVKNDLQAIKQYVLDDEEYIIQNNNYDCLYIAEILMAAQVEKFSMIERETLNRICLETDFEVPVAVVKNREILLREIKQKLEVIKGGGEVRREVYREDELWEELANDDFVRRELAFREETFEMFNGYVLDEVGAGAGNFSRKAFYELYLPEYYLIAGDHFYRYQIDRNEATLDQALNLLNNSLTIYLAAEEEREVGGDEGCALALAINAAGEKLGADEEGLVEARDYLNERWLNMDSPICALATYKAGLMSVEKQYQLYRMIEENRKTIGGLPEKVFYVGLEGFNNIRQIAYGHSIDNGIMSGLLSVE